jgi:cell division protein ZapA
MSDKTDTKTVTVTILDKEYLVVCPEEEHHDLIRSADYLDRKMREIRDAGKIIGSDRIAVMAALNISHELLTQNSESGKIDGSVGQRIKGLEAKIEDALYRSRQLEI